MRVPSYRFKIYVTLLIIFFLELTLCNKIRIMGMRPDILLVAVLFFGFEFGTTKGMEIGLVAGVLKDLFTIAPFGINTASFFIAGFSAGLLRNKLFRHNIVTQSFSSFTGVVLISALNILFLPYGQGSDFENIWRLLLIKAVYTALIAPIIFFILGIFLSEKKEETYNT